MSWGDLADERVVLRLRVSDLSRLAGVRGHSFPDKAAAIDFDLADFAEADLLPATPVVEEDWIILTKAELQPLDPGARPWIHLRIAFGETGSHWALIHWEDELGFQLERSTFGLRSLEVCLGGGEDPECEWPLNLVADHIPENPERVFACGDGGTETWYQCEHDDGTRCPNRAYYRGKDAADNAIKVCRDHKSDIASGRKRLIGKRFRYDKQVMTYVLALEFADRVSWPYESLPEEEQAQLPDVLESDDETIITLIKNLNEYEYRQEQATHTNDRVVYTRLFRPGSTGMLNRAERRRKLGHWYPIYRRPRADDAPFNRGGPLARLYAYLAWVGTNAPGRVRQAAVFSHAVVGGPSQIERDPHDHDGHVETPPRISRGGSPTHFYDASTTTFDHTDILPAFRDTSGTSSATPASFWVTGCNSDSGGLVNRTGLANVEGTARAFIRLITGIEDVKAHLAHAYLEQAREAIHALFDEHPDHRRKANWRIPGTDEEGLFGVTTSHRSGDVIADIRNFDDQVEALVEWADIATPSTDETDAAIAAADWIIANVTWDVILGRSIRGGGTVQEVIEGALQAVSAAVHYVAAFAHMAASNGRGDIVAYGGMPSVDGLHADVTLSLPGDDGNLHDIDGTISVYRRNRDSHSYISWIRRFYERLGLFTDHPAWYLHYTGALDADGAIPTGRTGTDALGFDNTQLNPAPPSGLTPAAY